MDIRGTCACLSPEFLRRKSNLGMVLVENGELMGYAQEFASNDVGAIVIPLVKEFIPEFPRFGIESQLGLKRFQKIRFPPQKFRREARGRIESHGIPFSPKAPDYQTWKRRS